MVEYSSIVNALDALNYWFVEVPPEILAQLPGRTEKGDYNQRLIITLDHTLTWQCGVLALGNGSGYISVQQKRIKELGKTLHDTVFIQLEKDHSEYGVPVAEVCLVYWEQVPEAKDYFDQLKPAIQRYILHHINQPKSEEKQLERTQDMFSRLLRANPKTVTFRYLLGKEG